ncbi:MAG TPA: hypothetical protein VNM92_13475 [Thermoanaerobaculia bacterium]|nr:hypothetical protein [Thermoanaerobaculia bacterium]
MGWTDSDASKASAPKTPSFLITAFLLLATILVHGNAINGWWLYDDPQLVIHAMENSAGSILFSPDAYRFLASHTFTPLLSLSFKLDFALAELDPRGFYLHQFLALALCVVLLFLLLRRYTRQSIAIVTTLAFILAPPTAIIARTLMMRHYLEGLLLASGALLLWECGGRGPGKTDSAPMGVARSPETFFHWSDIAAALLYLGAMLAKEIYAPLPLLMMVEAIWRGVRFREMARRLIPTVAAGAIFIVWRATMLGSPGGYGELPSIASIARLPFTILKESFNGSPAAVMIAGALLLLTLVTGGLIVSRRRWAVPVGAFALFALLPIVPLAARFELRYAFVAFLSLLVATAIASRRSIFSPRMTMALHIALCIVLAVASFYQLRQFGSVTAAMEAEGRYVWSAKSDAPALLASSPGWYLAGLGTLRQTRGAGLAPRFVLSREPMMSGEVATSNIVQSHWASAAITPLTADDKEQIRLEAGRFDATIPLSFTFRRHQHALVWNLEPAQGGSWLFLTHPYYGRYPIPSTGRNRIPDAKERQYFRVRRDVGDGRWNLSPVLELPTEGRAVSWSGTQAP